MSRCQPLIAMLCVCLAAIPPGAAQNQNRTPEYNAKERWYSPVTRPYEGKDVPPVNLSNSNRLESLIRAGILYLSLQDAIALALENNLDIEVQRYGPRIAEQDLLRAKAGGLLRGVPQNVSAGPTGVSSAGNLGTGTGGLGAGGVQPTTTNTNNAVVSQIGPPPPNLDPALTGIASFGHRTQLFTSGFTSGSNFLTQNSKLANLQLQEGFLTGTTASLGFNNTFLFQPSGRNDLNPSTTSSLGLTVTQHLLQGFGIAVNNRNIRIARNNLEIADLVFRQQLINTVSAVQTLYFDLVSFTEDVKVKRQALSLAEKLYNDNKKQVEIGTLAPIEIVRAEAEVASRQQDLTISETNVRQQETILKNALSRTGVASPTVSEVRIVPTDTIRMPETEPIEPVQDLMNVALESRPELAQNRISVENAKISLKGTRNGLLPTVDGFVDLRNNALAGQVNTIPIPPVPGSLVQTPIVRNPQEFNSPLVGGFGTALGQIFGRNYPDYSVGFQVNIPLRNRAAQADYARDQLSLRQSELRLQSAINQVRVDVQNALIALQQARARFQAAQKQRILQEQTLDAEQKKYALGASTIFLVIQAQRDLAVAQSSEVTALSNYSRARVQLDTATGQTIQRNNISVEEAMRGAVTRAPSPLPVLERP